MLSNFFPCEIEVGGVVFASVEHAFHASKLLFVGQPSLATRFAVAARGTPAYVGDDGGAVKRAGGRNGVYAMTASEIAAWSTESRRVLVRLWEERYRHAPSREVLLATLNAELWHDMGRGKKERWVELEDLRTRLRALKRRRRLHVVADDLGYSSSRDAGILRCFHAGGVTSASLLVNGASAREAVALAKAANLPIGLHLNLTEGVPISCVASISSLVDARGGRFLGKMGLRAAIAAGAVAAAEVDLEIRAQFAFFTELTGGAAPAHVDGHQHVHVIELIAPLFAAAVRDAGVSRTRVPILLPSDAVDAADARAHFYSQVSADAATAAPIFRHAGLSFAGRFVGFSIGGAKLVDARAVRVIDDALRDNDDDVEVMVHPGRTAEGEAAGCGDGPDDFALSGDRAAEEEALTGPLAAWMRF
jgi:predicted glycoside hydrolase/deacetylase ChbG (UPF0249 family)